MMSLFWLWCLALHILGLASAQLPTLTSSSDERQAACPGEVITFTCMVTNEISLGWTALPFITREKAFEFRAALVPQNGSVMMDESGQVTAVLTTFVPLPNDFGDFTSELRVTVPETLTDAIDVQCFTKALSSMNKVFTIIAPPSPPQGLRYSVTVYRLNDFTAAVQWESPASDGVVGIDSYTLTGAGITAPLTVLSNEPLMATLTLPYNELHMVSITVTASNCAGESTASVVTIHEVGCGSPASPPHGSLGDLTSSQEGAEVTFQCNPGLVPSQQMMSVCTNGSWTPDPNDLVCIQVGCGLPASPRDGTVNYNNTMEGSRATFQCSAGLVPEEVMTAVCENSGGVDHWSPNPGNLTCSMPRPTTGVPTGVVIAVVVAASIVVVVTVIIICICWRKRRSSDTFALKMAGAPDSICVNDIMSSPEMYPLAERLYDQLDVTKKTSESQQEYSQLQHNKPPPVSPNVTGDPTYSQLQQNQATGDVYSVVNKKPPPVPPYVSNDPSHSQLKQDQATGGEVYSVVNKKPTPVPPNDDPSHTQLKQDQATGGDVYSVVNKKPPPVPPYVADDSSHSQLKQDQTTGGEVYSVVNKKPPPVPPYVGDDSSHSQLQQDQATSGEVNQGPHQSSATDLL